LLGASDSEETGNGEVDELAGKGRHYRRKVVSVDLRNGELRGEGQWKAVTETKWSVEQGGSKRMAGEKSRRATRRIEKIRGRGCISRGKMKKKDWRIMGA